MDEDLTPEERQAAIDHRAVLLRAERKLDNIAAMQEVMPEMLRKELHKLLDEALEVMRPARTLPELLMFLELGLNASDKRKKFRDAFRTRSAALTGTIVKEIITHLLVSGGIAAGVMTYFFHKGGP